ncbi:hypothetical protein MRY87_01935 [bacterium]|nr:hypothetical protein [bacterium]
MQSKRYSSLFQVLIGAFGVVGLTVLSHHLGERRSGLTAPQMPPLLLKEESALALGISLPVDLVPDDLLEEFPGISGKTVQKIRTTTEHFCTEPTSATEHIAAPFQWESVPGIGEKKGALLSRFLAPPACAEPQLLPPTPLWSTPGAEEAIIGVVDP